jgi:hypothetical protein
LLLTPFTGLAKAAAVPANAFKQFMAPIQSLLSSIPLVGGALAAIPLTGVGFTAFLKSGMDEILAVGREARKLGIDVSSMSGLLIAAGDSAEAMSHGLGHMERAISEGSQGSKEAVAIFQAMGLSAETLRQMAPDEAFLAITDAIKGMGTAYDRAAAMQAVFGKAGLEMMPLLEKDLRAVIEAGEKTGQVFGESGFQNIKRAAMALGGIEKTIDGLKKSLTIAAAPFIEELAKSFQNFIDTLAGEGGFKQVIGNAIDWLMDKIAKLADALQNLVEDLKAGFSDFQSSTLFGRQGAASAARTILDKMGLGALALGGNLPGDGMAAASHSGARWGDAIRGLNDRVQSGLFDLSRRPGPAGEGEFPLELVKRLMDTVFKKSGPLDTFKDQLKDLKEALDKGAISFQRYNDGLGILDQNLMKTLGLGSPLTEFMESMSTVGQLKSLGQGGIASMLAGKAFLGLESSLGSSAATGSFGVSAGSMEDAERTIRDLNQQNHEAEMSLQQRMIELLMRQLAEQQQLANLGERVISIWESLGVVG